ncbi:MAG: tyrosine-type recombinase/integrase [Cyanobacteria bacterium P01_F01_bin.153]
MVAGAGMAIGKVSIVVNRGKLHLRWRASRVDKRRYTFSSGLEDDREGAGVNYAEVLRMAHRIEIDIQYGDFDPTLRKYSSVRQAKTATLGQLFELFLRHKSQTVVPRTLEKYRGLLGHLEKTGLAGMEAETSPERAITFARKLRNELSATTAREHLSNLGAMWEWGKLNGHIGSAENPWKSAKKSVKGAKVRDAVLFTDAEIERILNVIRSHPRYYVYLPLAAFLLSTGARLGEAKALQWQNISDDGRVEIKQTLTRDNLWIPTKNHRRRTFRLPTAIAEMLMRLKVERNGQPDDHVFLTERGNPVADSTWHRAWGKILELAEVAYRRPYGTRSTVITKSLLDGKSPLTVSTGVGNTPRVIYDYYAAAVQSEDIFKDPPSMEAGDD